MKTELAYLPALDESETIYSWCSKANMLHGMSAADFSLAMFGVRTAAKCTIVPPRLGHFCERLDNRLGRSELILSKHTALAAHLPLLTPSERTAFLGRAQSGGAMEALGVSCLSAIGVSELRFCPLCAQDDVRDLGYARWKLQHQLPGVFVCTTHEVLLEFDRERCTYWRKPRTDGTVVTGVLGEQKEGLSRLAFYSSTLSACQMIGAASLRRKTCRALVGAFSKPELRHLDHSRLEAVWRGSQTSEVLVEATAGRFGLKSGWIAELLQNRRGAANPLKWILLWSFLEELLGPSTRSLFNSIVAAGAADGSTQMPLWIEDGIASFDNIPQQVRAAFERHRHALKVAEELQMNVYTVRRWLNDNPEFRRAWKQHFDSPGVRPQGDAS